MTKERILTGNIGHVDAGARLAFMHGCTRFLHNDRICTARVQPTAVLREGDRHGHYIIGVYFKCEVGPYESPGDLRRKLAEDFEVIERK